MLTRQSLDLMIAVQRDEIARVPLYLALRIGLAIRCGHPRLFIGGHHRETRARHGNWFTGQSG
jgi:hypothetical protein